MRIPPDPVRPPAIAIATAVLSPAPPPPHHQHYRSPGQTGHEESPAESYSQQHAHTRARHTQYSHVAAVPARMCVHTYKRTSILLCTYAMYTLYIYIHNTYKCSRRRPASRPRRHRRHQGSLYCVIGISRRCLSFPLHPTLPTTTELCWTPRARVHYIIMFTTGFSRAPVLGRRGGYA